MNDLIDVLYRLGRGPRRRRGPDPVLIALVVATVVLLAGLTAGIVWLVRAVEGRSPPTAESRPTPAPLFAAARPAGPLAGGTAVYLPLAPADRPPIVEQPIWAPGAAGSGTVALFRKTFFLPAARPGVELSILADTRYEVWLDGAWLGRGPARFSRLRQEVDTYALGSLAAGTHAVAVLVQYAPNARRSESARAALQAGVLSWDGAAWTTLAATDPSWKALVSTAWDAAAGDVSPLGLIGPMEVLDLRRLPGDWSDLDFNDANWPQAHVVTPSPFPAISARSIPLLTGEPRAPAAVVDGGLLSPGYQLVEFQAGPGGLHAITATLAVTALLPATLRVEAVDTAAVWIDGGPPLDWQPLAEERRPDVVAAEIALDAGPHILSVAAPMARTCGGEGVPPPAPGEAPIVVAAPCRLAGGRTLAVRLEGLALEPGAGVSAAHDPGRRTLLANPVPGGPGAPEVRLLPEYAEIAIPAGDTPRYVVLDFGRTLHARPSLIAEGPAGTVIDAGWDERLTAGRALPNPGSLAANLWDQVDTWVLDGTPRRLSTIDARSGRYLLLQIFGPGPVVLREVRAVEEVYPLEQEGWFASSDPLLDRIWQTGADTLRPNMTDAYTDTPWRERGQWTADVLIAFYANRAAYGDLALFRRALRQAADAIGVDGRPAPLAPNGAGLMLLDYGMQWLEGLHEYRQLSGDLDLVVELYPAAGRLAGFLAGYEGAAGLLDVPPGPWSQTALVDWPAASSRSGESTALNAQYAAVLDDLAEMAAALGDAGQAAAYRERGAAVRAAINDRLYREDEGCYAASRVDGELKPCSPHAQAWALRYGAVPEERRASSTRSMLRSLTPFFNDQGRSAVEPPGMFYVLEALDAVNGTSPALKLIRERYGDLLARGATTWWELYSPNQHRFNSLSHAWGSSPTWFLSAHVLGARVTGPDRWRVAPHPGDLAFARGAVPMGAGRLGVDWRRPGCGRLELAIDSPAGTSGDLVLPLHRTDARVTLDGALIWDGGPVGPRPVEMTADGLVVSGLEGGLHDVAASFECRRVTLPLVRR